VTLDAQWNSLKQKNDLADLLQQQPAAIFINPVNWSYSAARSAWASAARRSVRSSSACMRPL
jgi:ribose transport system substrate-binding protein